MTGPVRPLDPGPWKPCEPTVWPPAQQLAITVPDLGCGHLPGEAHDGSCDYWRGVLTGEYPPPDAYMVTGGTYAVVLPRHMPGLEPLTDPALRGAA